MRLSGMKWLMRILWSLGLAVFLAGCSSTKYVPEGRFLLDDVKVYTADEEAKVGDLTSYLRQRPNAKWFSLFKVPLYVYGWSGRDTTKWLNRMWRRVGDAPVIYDGELSAQGQREMEKALQNMGYLHGRIVRQEERKGKKINDELDFDDSTYYDDDMEGEIGVPDDDLDEAEDEISKAPEDRIADMNQDDETV